MQPFFSIVVANYNSGDFILDMFRSLSNQTFKNFELILVDGCSTDSSMRHIMNNRDIIDCLIIEKDSGQSEAFNKGFNRASGMYMFWLNSDDFLFPDAMQKAYDYLVLNPRTEWLAVNTVFCNQGLEVLWCSNGPLWSNLFYKFMFVNVGAPSSIFKKDLFVEVGGFNEDLHYMMDTDLWMRFRNLGKRFERKAIYFFGFRVHKLSKTSHAFSGIQNNDFSSETIELSIKYGVRRILFIQVLFFLSKILNGNYIKSFIDTFRMKGNKILIHEN